YGACRWPAARPPWCRATRLPRQPEPVVARTVSACADGEARPPGATLWLWQAEAFGLKLTHAVGSPGDKRRVNAGRHTELCMPRNPAVVTVFRLGQRGDLPAFTTVHAELNSLDPARAGVG